MSIEKILDLSTAHISPNTSNILDIGADKLPFRYVVAKYGYVIWTPSAEWLEDEDFSATPEIHQKYRTFCAMRERMTA